ncbi:hypothetical protein AG1IA_09952 [Rhizoctonia solani AG-1 IA]|uniref:Uncharacterized protein n=1 Tax=Thanatephorus cucumeris (strain AG1-IA) TaxID=983506 RepID=L8WGV8_THACA|nr:hypothetical protein AG1IA_09952 [Rhizoctonia solani AG-1 IA]
MGSDEFRMLLYILCTTHGYRVSLSLDTIGRSSTHESAHLFPVSLISDQSQFAIFLHLWAYGLPGPYTDFPTIIFQVRLREISRLHNIGRSRIIHPAANSGHNAFRSVSFHEFIDRRHDWRYYESTSRKHHYEVIIGLTT